MVSVKRQLAKEATKAKLLAAAREAFHEWGYEGVTIRDLAKSIGMSTGAVFSNFSDKGNLFVEATGQPAPEMPHVAKWLLHIATCAAEVRGDDERAALLTEIADDAMKLRRQIVGEGADEKEAARRSMPLGTEPGARVITVGEYEDAFGKPGHD